MRPARNASATISARERTSKAAAIFSRRSLIVCALRSTSAAAAGWQRLGEPHGRARGASGVQRALSDTPEILPRACARRTSIKPGARSGNMVPKGGLEPPRVAPHAPQTCASASSATSAREQWRSIPSTSTSAKPSDALPQPRIERVANAFAEQVVGQHGEQDGDTGIDGQPPGELDDFLAVVE